MSHVACDDSGWCATIGGGYCMDGYSYPSNGMCSYPSVWQSDQYSCPNAPPRPPPPSPAPSNSVNTVNFLWIVVVVLIGVGSLLAYVARGWKITKTKKIKGPASGIPAYQPL